MSDDRARRFAELAVKRTGRGVLSPEEVSAEMNQPHCRWCHLRAYPNTPCSCARGQEEARRIRAGS